MEELNLREAHLAEDVLALRKLIQEGKMPVLRELELWFNDFRNMSDSLGKQLEAIEQKLDDCCVRVIGHNLPGSFNQDQYKSLEVMNC